MLLLINNYTKEYIMSSFLLSSLIILAIFGAVALFNYFRLKGAVTKLPYEEFRKDLRKVQLIDVRE